MANGSSNGVTEIYNMVETHCKNKIKLVSVSRRKFLDSQSV